MGEFQKNFSFQVQISEERTVRYYRKELMSIEIVVIAT